jgi:predicted lysophospholipase L1 biosynthesis ABC-type transport system permease subunit
VDAVVAVLAGLVVAVVAFRRARRVQTPQARRAAARQAIGSRSRRFATAVLTVARAAVGVAALVFIVWLTGRLFS